MSGSSGKLGLEQGTVDQGLNLFAQSRTSKGTSASVDDLLFGQVSDDIPQPNVPLTGDLLNAQPTIAENAHGYNLRTHIPANPNIEFDELLHQRAVSKQHQLAATWTKMYNTLQSEISSLRTNIYTVWDPKSAQETADRIVNDWKHFEEIHNDYLTGIKDKKRLETVQIKYMSIKELASNVFDEFKGQLQVNEQAARGEAFEIASVRSDCSHLSNASKTSSQKQKLRTMLLAKRKLELAKARQREEIENAKILQEMTARKEIRKLEEEAALAEVEWQVETDRGATEEIQAKTYEDHGNIQHSTPKEDVIKPYQTIPPAMSTLQPNVTPPDSGYPATAVLNTHPPVSWSPGYEDEHNLAGKRVPVYDGQQSPTAPRVPVYDGQQSPAAPLVPVYDGQQSLAGKTCTSLRWSTKSSSATCTSLRWSTKSSSATCTSLRWSTKSSSATCTSLRDGQQSQQQHVY